MDANKKTWNYHEKVKAIFYMVFMLATILLTTGVNAQQPLRDNSDNTKMLVQLDQSLIMRILRNPNEVDFYEPHGDNGKMVVWRQYSLIPNSDRTGFSLKRGNNCGADACDVTETYDEIYLSEISQFEVSIPRGGNCLLLKLGGVFRYDSTEDNKNHTVTGLEVYVRSDGNVFNNYGFLLRAFPRLFYYEGFTDVLPSGN